MTSFLNSSNYSNNRLPWQRRVTSANPPPRARGCGFFGPGFFSRKKNTRDQEKQPSKKEINSRKYRLRSRAGHTAAKTIINNNTMPVYVFFFFCVICLFRSTAAVLFPE